jgi:hypothetical protein
VDLLPWTSFSYLERNIPVIYLRNDLIDMLRRMARNGQQPSAMLREMVVQLGADAGDRPVLVRYFSAAFSFSEGQGYKIFGWFPDGTGTLQDSDIDILLSPRILETRPEWENSDSACKNGVAVDSSPAKRCS